jgi:hypothetical protein
MSYMTSVAAQTAEFFGAPKLRLLSSRSAAPKVRPGAGAHAVHAADGPPTLRLIRADASEGLVLVAGADSAARASVLGDLADKLPPSTNFAQADTFWEVLVRAPSSSMVILSGELDELPAESLMQMLAHRHPGLPVVSVAASAPSAR